MFNNMETFNMYVKTLVINEKNKILLLKQKTMDETPRWDLPGVHLTEDESFDEAVTNNMQKQIGYYLYPGRILGVNDYVNHNDKEIHVIMETEILNGELLLDSNYDEYVWIPVNRIADYPLAAWFQDYIKKNRHPFTDVDDEIDKINERQSQRREIFHEEIAYETPRRSRFGTSEPAAHEDISVKNSLGILKDTIIRTFHPKKSNVTKTHPKENIIYTREENTTEEATTDDVETVDIPVSNEIIPESSDDIIPDHVTKTLKTKKPEIRKIRETNRPYVRKSKESTERLSFNSERLNRSNWREKLNNLNKTEANKERKQAPRPKQRK
jgi:ADP-ribose pyrophosphatase YjhB (NUDIX family)